MNMLLPIYAYGSQVLREESLEIDKDYPELKELIENMFETMYSTEGVGLAAPQIGKTIRLVVIDASPFSEQYPEAEGFRKILINPEIIEEEGEEWLFNEGCLSVPEVREEISRKPVITLWYQDENFNEYEEKFEGIQARVIQHEYDHLEGKLFIDRVKPVRKMLIKGKLNDVMKGKVDIRYAMKFPKLNKKRR